MGIRNYRPTSPGTRFKTSATFEELSPKTRPLKKLTQGKKRIGGRNNAGRTTVRFRGGSHKRRYRVVDFRRDKRGIEARVATIEYDPNRSARIALLHYRDGEKRYILWPDKLAVGATVKAGADADIDPGNALPLRNIPLGTVMSRLARIRVKLAKRLGGGEDKSAHERDRSRA